MRAEARVSAFKVIFSMLFGSESENVSQAVFNESAMKENDEEFAKSLIDSFTVHKTELAEIVKSVLSNYEIDRVYKIDLALIYLAVTEIKYLETPKPIVVNEVLNIAKKFSTENSQKFVNGVLAKID